MCHAQVSKNELSETVSSVDPSGTVDEGESRRLTPLGSAGFRTMIDSSVRRIEDRREGSHKEFALKQYPVVDVSAFGNTPQCIREMPSTRHLCNSDPTTKAQQSQNVDSQLSVGATLVPATWDDSDVHRVLPPRVDAPNYGSFCAQFQRASCSWLTHVVKSQLSSEFALQPDVLQSWTAVVLDLANEVCASINPNIRGRRDSMDVRPYVKIKSIPGGSDLECRIVDGIVFRKDIVNKLMRKSASKPRILIIAGGVEFHRTQSKLASFSTLSEQEQKFTEILVDRIVQLRPHLLLVGRSISRQAQECLRAHDVVAMQHVKSHLLRRVARMTGATILSSTDHVTSMGQHAHHALGLCDNFQVVKYPAVCGQRRCTCVLSRSRCQARAGCSGHSSYIYLTGCSKALGCTIMLRGTSRQHLKKLKCIVRAVTFIAYHHRLENAFLRDSNATTTLCGPSPDVPYIQSEFQSLNLKNARGRGQSGSTLLSNAFAHQALLVTFLWMSLRSQCAPAEIKGFIYYSERDTSLGEFLVDSCFALDSKYAPERRSMYDSVQMLYHNDGCVVVSLLKSDQHPMSYSPEVHATDSPMEGIPHDGMIYTWGYCKRCDRVVAPIVRITTDAWKISFGKFLEMYFYNGAMTSMMPGCVHNMRSDVVRYFGMHNVTARFEYESIQPYAIRMRHVLPFDRNFYYQEMRRQHYELRLLTLRIFAAFEDKADQLQLAVDQVATSIQKLLPCARELDEFPKVPGTSNVLMLASAVHVVRTEVRQVAKDIQFSAMNLGKQIKDELDSPLRMPTSDSCGLEDIFFPSPYRRELHTQASKLNQRFSLLGQITTMLRDSCLGLTSSFEDASSLTNLDTGLWGQIDLVIHELQQLQLSDTTTRSTPRSAANDALEEGGGDDDGHDSNEVADFDMISPGREPTTATTDSTSNVRLSLAENGFEDRTSRAGRGESDKPTSVRIGPRASVAPTVRWERSQYPATRRTYKISNALARFLGKDSIQEDPWTVQLDEIQASRSCVDSTALGDTLLVHEEQPTTVIAYSLNTVFYKRAVEAHTSLMDNLRLKDYMSCIGLTLNLTAENSSECTCVQHLIRSGGLFTDARSAKRRAWTKAIGSVSGSARSVTPDQSFEFALQSRCLETVKVTGLDSSTPSVGECAETRRELDTAVSSSDTAKSTTISYATDGARDSPEHTFRLCGQSRSCVSGTCVAHSHTLCNNSIKLSSRLKLERCMLARMKTHIKHRFADVDEKGNTLCKFVCHAYWATQFAAVRQAYFQGNQREEELGFLRSLALARPWNAQGGKSGATFLKTTDGRFVVKQITRTELQMFIEYAPAYFEYLSKTFFHNYATLLVKVLGVYQIGSHNRVSGKKLMEQVVVMQNLFHERTIHRVFDLKGSTRSRYTRVIADERQSRGPSSKSTSDAGSAPIGGTEPQPVLLDENFLEFTHGRPLPLNDQAKAYFDNAVLNDTLFLSLINVVDYSILVGINHLDHHLVVGIIDYMRQYDIIKKVERMGKSVGMIAGQAEPTVIQPPNYRNRFQGAMAKYFMMVPNRWTSFLLEQLDNAPLNEVWLGSGFRST